MQQLGYEVLLTILIPGLILLVASGVLVDTLGPDGFVAATAAKIFAGEWQATLVAITAGTFLGSLLASLLGYIESLALDPLAAWRLSIKKHAYDAEWDRYIDSLEQAHNSYISRLVLFFQFETRSGLASFVLGVALSTWPKFDRPCVGVGLLVLGALLFLVGSQSHYALACFRHRRFGPMEKRSLTQGSA